MRSTLLEPERHGRSCSVCCRWFPASGQGAPRLNWSPNLQYSTQDSLFCGSCSAQGYCPGGGGPCTCIVTGEERHKCWDNRPCDVLCLERRNYARIVHDPRLRPLWSPISQTAVPHNIPFLIPFGSLRMGLTPPALSWISFDARELFYLSGRRGSIRRISSSPVEFRLAAGIDARANVLVYLNAPDPELEGLYAMGNALAPALQTLGVQVVGAPTYSVYIHRPRVDQIFNLQRMFTVLSELSEQGLPVIPTVFYAREADVVAWRDWLLANPNVWLIGVVVQRQEEAFYQDQITQITRIQRDLEQTGRSLHVLLYGVGSPHRASTARDIGLRRFACVSSNAAMAAGEGRLLTYITGRLKSRKAPEFDRNQLFAKNLAHQIEALAAVIPAEDGLISHPEKM